MKLHLICINFSSPDTFYTLNCHRIQKQENGFRIPIRGFIITLTCHLHFNFQLYYVVLSMKVDFMNFIIGGSLEIFEPLLLSER